MRLISTLSTLGPLKDVQFKDFFDDAAPKYAILSHRWGRDQEVSYKELRKGQAPLGAGLQKIIDFCSRAASQGCDWAWVDTCCIDKRSSAELTEAINSMYKWYQAASVCYVHLADIGCGSGLKLGQSEWFKRGWTLQELLAPENVDFYDKEWRLLGDKKSLVSEISAATGIPLTELVPPKRNLVNHEQPSVAMKMSWAAGRCTSRSEDIAYCLMGLFDVNMPLLYGEGGKKAFQRLQLEIIKLKSDESIFAFELPSKPSLLQNPFYNFLAPSPDAFRDSGNIVAPLSRFKDLKEWYNKDYRYLVMEVPESEILDYSIGSLGSKFSSFVILLQCFRKEDLLGQVKGDGRIYDDSKLRHVAIRVMGFGPNSSAIRDNPKLEFYKRSSSTLGASKNKNIRLVIGQ